MTQCPGWPCTRHPGQTRHLTKLYGVEGGVKCSLKRPVADKENGDMGCGFSPAWGISGRPRGRGQGGRPSATLNSRRRRETGVGAGTMRSGCAHTVNRPARRCPLWATGSPQLELRIGGIHGNERRWNAWSVPAPGSGGRPAGEGCRVCGGHLAPDHDEARSVYERACVNSGRRYAALKEAP